MSRVFPIDVHKTASFLFENAEEIPNSLYIRLMKSLQTYYDCAENEADVIAIASELPPSIRNQVMKCIQKPESSTMTCSCKLQCPAVRCFQHWSCTVVFVSLATLLFLGVIIFSIAFTKNATRKLAPPPPF